MALSSSAPGDDPGQPVSASDIADTNDPDLDFLDDEAPGFERFKSARVVNTAAKKRAVAIAQLTDSSDELAAGLTMSYNAARHERVWLESSLKPFYDQSLIDDIVASVKGGKEASVYVCRVKESARAGIGHEFVAAKVYRPRAFRSLRNDAMYRSGRQVLTDDGRAAKATDHRLMRAIGKKTAFGVQAAHSSWLLHEFVTLGSLRKRGASVPEPFAVAENAILMEFFGDEFRGAPTLIEVGLSSDEARLAWRDVRATLAAFRDEGVVHGDLSAYNFLWHNGRAIAIDFPQIVRFEQNDAAEAIFSRDIDRVCDYFERAGITIDRHALKSEMRPKTDA